MHPTRGKLSDFTKIPEHLTSFSQVLSPLYWIGSIQISLPSLIPRQIGSLSVSPRRSSSIVVYASQRHPDAFATVQERGVGINPRGKTQEVVSMVFSGSVKQSRMVRRRKVRKYRGRAQLLVVEPYVLSLVRAVHFIGAKPHFNTFTLTFLFPQYNTTPRLVYQTTLSHKIMAYTYRYLEDRASLPSTSSSSCSDTGESSRTSTSYSDDLRKELQTADQDFDDLHYPFPAQPTSSPSFIRRHPVFCSIALIFWGCIAGIHIAFPFPTTIPVFVGAALGLLAFTILDWYRLITSIYASRRRSDAPSPPASPCITPTLRCSNDTPRPPPYTPHSHSTVNVSRVRKIRLIISTALILFWLHLGIIPPAEHVPVLHRSVPSRPEKYFIAANMYNNEDVFEGWSQELLKLCDYRE